MQITDEVQQRAEWRSRLIADVLSNAHDEDTRADMLEAALNQAHSEGLLDAAHICQRVADADATARRVAGALAKAIRKLVSDKG